MAGFLSFITSLFKGKRSNDSSAEVPQQQASAHVQPKIIETNVTQWVIDDVHSKINFKILHMEIAEVIGIFKDIQGKVTLTLPNMTDLKVELSIPASTVNTEFPQRDMHIKSPDFLDVEKYPHITFQSTKVTWKPLKRFIMDGKITLKGVTKDITFEGGLLNTLSKDLTGEPRVGFKVSGKLNRLDFGVNFDMKLEGGERLASDIVEFEGHIELTTPTGYERLKQFIAANS